MCIHDVMPCSKSVETGGAGFSLLSAARSNSPLRLTAAKLLAACGLMHFASLKLTGSPAQQ